MLLSLSDKCEQKNKNAINTSDVLWNNVINDVTLLIKFIECAYTVIK